MIATTVLLLGACSSEGDGGLDLGTVSATPSDKGPESTPADRSAVP